MEADLDIYLVAAIYAREGKTNILRQDRERDTQKNNKLTSPRLRLFDNQKWSETGTRPRVPCL